MGSFIERMCRSTLQGTGNPIGVLLNALQRHRYSIKATIRVSRLANSNFNIKHVFL